MNEQYDIQPLRLLSGWSVELNNFYECEPDSCYSFEKYFIEDLLQLKNSKFNLIIDLGWYPDGDRNGKYHLCLVKDYKWDKPLEVYECRDTKTIVKKIEYWSNYGFYQKFINLL